MLDESGDVEEGFTPGVPEPFAFACVGVRLARRAGNEYVDALREVSTDGGAEEVGIEGDAFIPMLECGSGE